MSLSLQEISDRFEIQDLLYRYADIIDRRAVEELSGVFTTDAHIDYSAFGGSVGDVGETMAFLREALPAFSDTQHLNANIQLWIDGDNARGRVMCFNPMVMPAGGEEAVFMLGLWYADEYRRESDGWRISRRVEEKSWVFNAPEFMAL
ncbi:nuclear transport factor 2 family protein [Spongiibacter sp. KMU-166]|uniref:Nuclear transport factor 2 family protein n=1 Tax=Spongiibacter thalassae TaxID=2721624 RepID=A0ABX1GDM2_9GAMM|nr:nuclear transport factor 2 family protein [Spongiibacter thalassae]NKI17256.1 nuclear transport factor 2 family protein [Spongiibacter thalassae]